MALQRRVTQDGPTTSAPQAEFRPVKMDVSVMEDPASTDWRRRVISIKETPKDLLSPPDCVPVRSFLNPTKLQLKEFKSNQSSQLKITNDEWLSASLRTQTPPSQVKVWSVRPTLPAASPDRPKCFCQNPWDQTSPSFYTSCKVITSQRRDWPAAVMVL